jgi:hypothetical protein
MTDQIRKKKKHRAHPAAAHAEGADVVAQVARAPTPAIVGLPALDQQVVSGDQLVEQAVRARPEQPGRAVLCSAGASVA